VEAMTATRLSDEYLTLIRQFPLIPIKNKRQLRNAIVLMKELSTPSRLASLSGAESDYLDVLADLIAKYEREHFKQLTEPMTGAEALQYLLEESGTSQSELARRTGTRQSHISEFIVGARDLSKESIVRIARFFKVSPELFLPRV
jgi:HTH-type transcriptional regulator/antitoxin HigA